MSGSQSVEAGAGKAQAGAVARRHCLRPGKLQRVQTRVAWLFVAPFLLLFTVFIAVPIATSFAMSLTNISAREIRRPLQVDFIGIENFINVLGTDSFQQSIGTTALFVVLCVPISMGGGLLLALILDKGIRRLRTFFRSAIYLPVIANIVAAAVIWRYAFAPSGPINEMLAALGADGLNWLGDPTLATGAVVLVSVWRNIGTCMVLFLAGLQTVPSELYEASSIDGASSWRQFRSVTLPVLMPTTLLVSVLMTVAFLNIFEEPYLLTSGGPLGSTRSIALWVYERFGFGNISEAMAGSFLLLILIGVITALQFRVLRTKA